MKLILISLCLMMTTLSQAGGFRWPNIEYDHAKLYLLNIPFKTPTNLDYHVYHNGVYANTKVGEGIDLPQDFLDQFHATMARGVDELVYGLSECYIPRHGIIYFDKLGKPVASFTACFQCDRISFWSSNELPKFRDDVDRMHIEKADEQSAKMQALMKEFGYPMFDNEKEYELFVLKSEDLKNEGEMFLQDPRLDSLYYEHYSIEEVKGWANEKSRRKIYLTETEETKITAGGDKWTYKQLADDKGTRFIFSMDEENPFLVEATITSNLIILPNGVSVGMSIDDVMNTFLIYDGIAWPEHIQVKDKYLVIDYFFKRRTLTKITASFSIV